MIFSQRKALVCHSLKALGALEPRRSNESCNGATDDILQQRAAIFELARRFIMRKPKKLALASRQSFRFQLCRARSVSAFVKMSEAVEEHLASSIRPSAQLSRKAGMIAERPRPMKIGNDEHRITPGANSAFDNRHQPFEPVGMIR